MEEYRRRLPDSANAIDSAGEVHFYFGKFEEASRLFLEAHAKNPGLIGGIEPLRAAFALYMGGNLQAANTLVGTLRQGEPAAASFRPALWRRMTGQPQAGMPDTGAAKALQALWLLADGNRSGAAAAAATAFRQSKDPAERSMAGLAALLSQPSATVDVWKDRLARALPAPQAANERQRLLAWALLLDKQPAAAADTLRNIVTRLTPPSGNEERLLLASALIEAGKTSEARKVLPHGFMPPASFDPSLPSLIWKRARDVYRKLR
jgi:hypothetical protein